MSESNINHNCRYQCQCQCHRQCHRDCHNRCHQKREDPNKTNKNTSEIQYFLCSDRLLIVDSTYTEMLYFPWATNTTKKMTNGIITLVQLKK